MFATPNPRRLKNVFQSRHRKQRDFDILLRRVDVEIFDLRKSCPILRPEPDNNRDVLVSLLVNAYRISIDGSSRGGCDIGIRNSDQVGAIWINLDLHLRAIGAPVVPQHGNSRRLANDVHGLRRDGPKRSDILALGPRVGICLACNKDLNRSFDWVRLQLTHRDPRARDLFIELILKRSNQLWSGFLVAHLHDDLRIVRLGRFGSDGKPETWSAAADETCHGSEKMLSSLLFCSRFRSTFNKLAYNLLGPHCGLVCRA